MRFLITAGPTHEPIDPVRFIGNRSSGRMGAALAEAAKAVGHDVTLILGPVAAPMPASVRRIDVVTAAQMHQAVLREFPSHDVLIMAAAVADFRPKSLQSSKIERGGSLTIELESTDDIAAAAGKIKTPAQRTIGFSLVPAADRQRSLEKLNRKNLDLIVHNPIETLESPNIKATLIYRDGRSETPLSQDKNAFAKLLIDLAGGLF